MNRADAILDAALDLAERHGWEAVRLHQVAQAANLSLDDIRQHFREKDALIDAWFDRADATALAVAARDASAWARLSPRQRLYRLIMAWLDALEPRHRVTRQMVLSKLELGHLHIQIPAVMRVSRTVQWLREAALLHDAGLARALAETAVTGIYLATFLRWLAEDTLDSPATRHFLDRLLERAERAALACPLLTGTPSAETDSSQAPPPAATDGNR